MARPAGADSVPRDALPRADERLPQPMMLPHCAWLRIVEWKATVAFQEETSASQQAIEIMDDACMMAREKYPEFLRSIGITPVRSAPTSITTVSLLPANVLLDGKDARNLNDVETRFGAVAPKCCYWGLYVHKLHHLFVRNDPLLRAPHGSLHANPRFLRTFLHELGHVLSAQLGVWDRGHDRARDEQLAEEFVAFLGMRFPTESSSDDLAFHLGRR